MTESPKQCGDYWEVNLYSMWNTEKELKMLFPVTTSIKEVNDFIDFLKSRVVIAG